MTIAAGFVCSDGLLFASDTMYFGEQITYGQKFWTFVKGDAVIVFGGAGLSASLKRTRDLIDETVTASMTRAEIVTHIERALKYVEDLMAPRDDERTWALVGIRMDGNYWLYWNDGGRCALSVLDVNSFCVGAGHSLGLYFARSLFRTNMPIKWGKVVAVHLVNHVKKYESGYCGGDTHLVELPLEGNPRFVKDQNEIRELEQHLAEVEDAMSIVLPGEDKASDDSLNHRLEMLSETIRKLRLSQVIRLSPAHLVTSSGMFKPLMNLALSGEQGNTALGTVTPTVSDTQAPEVRSDPKSPKDDQPDQPPSLE